MDAVVRLTGRTRARRDFVVTPYRGRGECLVPDMPKCCLAHDAAGCRIRVNHYRPRKTGPCFALCVVECVTHQRIFTLYPPGYVPYGRAAVAPVSSDGASIADDAGGDDAWELTIYRAAYDAERGIAWPRRLAPGDGERRQETWRTQGRRIVLAGSLLGVLSEPGRAQPAMAAMLGIPALVLRDASTQFHAPGWRRYAGRGRAVVSAHRALAHDCVLDRLLAASALAGQSGVAHRWDQAWCELRVRAPP